MKKYIEAIEQGEGEDLDFIQEEITPDSEVETNKEFNGVKIIERTYSKTEETKSLDKVKLLEDSEKTYKRRIHTHFHDEGKPCTVEDIS